MAAATSEPGRWRLPLPDSLRYRLAVAARAVAAIGGGYGLAALADTAMALWLPMSRSEAVITATLLSFVVWVCAVMWVFAARSAWRAWLGVAAPSAVLAALLWLLHYRGGAA